MTINAAHICCTAATQSKSSSCIILQSQIYLKSAGTAIVRLHPFARTSFNLDVKLVTLRIVYISIITRAVASKSRQRPQPEN